MKESPERQAARAWLAEPAVAAKIKGAIQNRFLARITMIAAEETDAEKREFLADLEEEGCLRLMKQVMGLLAVEHLRSGRGAAERMLAFLLPLVQQAELQEPAS